MHLKIIIQKKTFVIFVYVLWHHDLKLEKDLKNEL
jgi:hypothetical protein